MYYEFDLFLPPSTPEYTPVRKDVKLTHGVIHRIEVGFPAGCAGLAHVSIYQGANQLWPTNPDGSFATDNWVIVINEFYELTQPPYTLTLVGWNFDTVFPHTPKIRFGILPRWVLQPEQGLARILQTLARRFRL